MIVCSKCKIEKPKTEFHNNKARHNGKSAYCIACDTKRKQDYLKTEKGKASIRRRAARYREKYPEKSYEACKKNRKKKQDLINEVKKSGCIVCGYNKCPQALDLHHVNSSEKENTLSNLVFERGIAYIVEEIKKCVVLCSNCHREHHAGILDIPEME